MNAWARPSSGAYPELEIVVRRTQYGHEVTLRFTDAESETEVAPASSPFPFDAAALLAQSADAPAYGVALASQLFDGEAVRELYGNVKAVVESGNRLLRLRLTVDGSAPELHAVRWELLADPATKAPLATSEKTLFSRFMVSRDWRPIRPRAKARLTALVAVAEGSDLASKYGLSAGYRARAIADAESHLTGMDVQVIGKTEPVTLARLVEHLRQGVDILYLVCHGVLDKALIPRLYLQDDAGKTEVVPGRDLTLRINELRAPRLVVLASCESAGAERRPKADEPSPAQAALAPLLADVGVHAVLAMQGRITVETVNTAMPVFFAELSKDGQMDRAMAAARGAVRGRPDAWMPALFLRLKGGSIWYEPRFSSNSAQFDRWKSTCLEARQGKLIPIIGPDLSEWIVGTAGDLAGRLADQNRFPLSPHDRTNLARVAQYLTISQSPRFAQDAVATELSTLARLLEAAAKQRRESDPCRMLAELPASVYVTASIEPSLFAALKAVGRNPTKLFCRWRPTARNHPREPKYEGTPTPAAPIVYHVFGLIDEPESLVLTEDDFFDYLIATATYKLMPKVVRAFLTANSLMFIGFSLDDWSFRVLFRLIMTLEGSANLKEYSHVGVQVDPAEQELADAVRARRYLERYFVTDTRAGLGRSEPSIDLYWGSAQDFLGELLDKLKTQPSVPVPVKKQEPGGGWF